MDSVLERILASLHAAAIGDARWTEVSGLIDEACGTKGNFLVSGDGETSDDVDIFFARFCFRGERNEEMERLYFRSYHGVDERVPRIRRLPDSELVHVSSLYTDEEKKTSPAYNEALALSHTSDSLNVRLDGPGGSRIVWAVGDPIDRSGWSSARVESVERLLPHLRQFVRVRQALVDARALGASGIELLGNRRVGVIQLDRRARVVAANDIASAMLRARDTLLDERGELRAALRDDDAELRKLVARAVPYGGGVGASGSMVMGRAGSGAQVVVHVTPISAQAPVWGASPFGALVLVTDLANRMQFDPDRVGELLGLTRAQSHIACALAEGRTVREIAAARERTEASVRFHLKHIFTRHALSRQVELVELVRSLADLVPSVRR